MTDETISLDARRGMAAQKATDVHRLVERVGKSCPRVRTRSKPS